MFLYNIEEFKEDAMKLNLVGILAVIVFMAACGKTVETKYSPIDPKAKNYAEALKSADKTCKVNEDCIAVQKGCCPCNGQESVNKAAARALQPIRERECASGVCTLQMCYTDINVSCQRGLCVGTPKPMKDYFAK